MARRKTTSNSETLFENPAIPRTLAEEVESAFLDYSMSVIVSRALPDVRDGLKPVHRRILWAMHDAGLRPDRPFVKSARVIGDVMANYHPHGDSAIYDALVRMGQDFSLSHTLVDKHGNFGSPSDPPAASRYTECRLAVLATELLAAIDEGTVDFDPNYDASRDEPVVLPGRFPNLLVNGGQGIAVGMATNIPPHNLAEVCDAALSLIANPEATISDLMKKVKGPDFPTGALIMGDDAIKDAYKTGRGTLRLRAVTEIEQTRRGKAIVISEIPYQTSVDAIAGRLAEAVESGKIEGIRDIRNESGQGKTRLVVELRPDVNEQVVLKNVFKHTPAQTTFGINMVALVDGVPRTLNLLQALQHWVDHQSEVVTRRTRFRLDKAEARLHIVDGLVRAIDVLDAIIKKIRASKDRSEARAALMAQPFEFSEIQANHILDLALGRLTQLGREELLAEQAELKATIAGLRKILGSREVLMGVIRDELKTIRDAHAMQRRTQVVKDDTGEISVAELVDDEPLVVSVTARGYIQAKSARGRGSKLVTPGDKDAVAVAVETFALASMLFFTDRGRVYRAACHDLPKQRLTAAQNLFQMVERETVIAALSTDLIDEHANIVFVTAAGQIKRTPFSELADISNRKDGVAAMKVDDSDRVVAAYAGWDDFECLVVTAGGQGIRFAESEVRPVSRSAGGMRAIKLKSQDGVVGACAVAHEEVVVLCTEAGYAKRVRVDEIPVQARGGSGVRVSKQERGRGALVAITPLSKQVAFVTADACIVVADTEIKLQPRDGAGYKVPGLADNAEIRIVTGVADYSDEG